MYKAVLYWFLFYYTYILFVLFLFIIMTEENLTPTFKEPQSKNTVALIWLIISIIWLLCFISILGIFFAIPLLFVWFILWVIWLFYKPRWKAIAAIIISLLPWLFLVICWKMFYAQIENPVQDFKVWAEENLSGEAIESMDKDRLNILSNQIANNKINELFSWDFMWKLNAATGSSTIEKWAYLFFEVMKESLNEGIEAYNNWAVIENNNSSIWSAISLSIDTTSDSEIDDEIITGEEVEDWIVCTDEYAPVCWDDGNIYGNSCYLERAWVNLDDAAVVSGDACIAIE